MNMIELKRAVREHYHRICSEGPKPLIPGMAVAEVDIPFLARSEAAEEARWELDAPDMLILFCNNYDLAGTKVELAAFSNTTDVFEVASEVLQRYLVAYLETILAPPAGWLHV